MNFLIHIANASGVESYHALAPIGNFVQQDVSVTNLTAYLNGMFKLGIAIAGALAVIMIIWGGIQYMSTDSINGQSEGKKKITAAITGLIVALGSYMLLNTISPDLLATNLNLQPVSVQGIPALAPGQPGYPYQQGTQNYGLNYYGDPYANTSTGGAFYDGSQPRLDTDGGSVYAYLDPTHSDQTSLGGLNAATDPYVVVNDPSQLGQYFLVTNQTTGQSVVAIGGDIGHGFGEVSAATAQAIGMWSPAQGDSLPEHHITITPWSGPPPGK